MFYFTHIEMVYFLIGQNLAPVLIYGLSWTKLHSDAPDSVKQLITPELFHFGSATIYFVMFFITHKYISYYIYREDDLTGQTDAIKRMVKDSFQGDTFDMVVDILKKLMFPSSLLILNLAITPLANRVFTIASNSTVAVAPDFLLFWVSRLCIIPGIYLGKFFILKSLTWINLLTLLRLGLFAFLVVDNFCQFALLQIGWLYKSLFGCFYLSLGFCLINLYAQSAARNEDWKRKKVGFIMFVSTVLGLAYGDILGMTAIKTEIK